MSIPACGVARRSRFRPAVRVHHRLLTDRLISARASARCACVTLRHAVLKGLRVVGGDHVVPTPERSGGLARRVHHVTGQGLAQEPLLDVGGAVTETLSAEAVGHAL
jgi:hypothetical protein